MARSVRKTAITGNAPARSEKDDKRCANRKLRRKTKQCLMVGAEILPALREISDTRDFAKDGKKYSPRFSLRK